MRLLLDNKFHFLFKFFIRHSDNLSMSLPQFSGNDDSWLSASNHRGCGESPMGGPADAVRASAYSGGSENQGRLACYFEDCVGTQRRERCDNGGRRS